jgi:hypothetical protein
MSEVKVNKISPRSGTEVTLGDSGDTFTIPSGATINNQGTATNFGATGSASWVTTVKTTDFTAVAGEGYFVNSTSGEIDVTLPAGTAGAVVAVADYANTCDTNNIILKQNGSDKIEGSTDDFPVNQEGVAVTLVFVDSTKGWIVTDTGQSSDASVVPTYMTASGGNTTTTVGDFKVHAFTGPGTFTVSSVGNAAGSNTVQYMVVAGGGGGSNSNGGGGGAGGFRMASCFTAPAAGYPITVGAGGGGHSPPGATAGGDGGVSTFSTITSAGGGGGGSGAGPAGAAGPGRVGGSGGGGGTNNECGAAGNTPPTDPPQGNNGGDGAGPGTPQPQSGGGGGGAAAVGGTHDAGGPAAGGNGSPAAPIFGSAPQPYYIANGPANGASVCGTFAGGGGGGRQGAPVYPGGTGGGGNGTTGPATGANGTTNTGGGAGGGGYAPAGAGGNGGSGIVLIRYKFQN